jgi:hypothetical protein
VGRLLPQVGAPGGPVDGGRDEGWRRERLFSAVADLLGAVAGEPGAGLVVEDVHWADSATLDFLTFLARAGHRHGVTVVATCRGDEAPLAAPVTDWLMYVRGAAGVAEIRLGPLSRAEAAEQVAALAGGPVPSAVVDEVFVRAEGNPFFTEQLVAAALPAAPGGGLRVPAGLPARLAELLAARAGRCADDARVVLAGLAVAGRPLADDQVGAVAGLSADRVRRGLRELAAARLLAEDTAGGAHRPRHVLLAEAVAAGLLPGERAVLHERTARALEAAGGGTLAAEAAGHWQAAGRPSKSFLRESRQPRRPSGCSVTRKRPRTGSGPSNYPRHSPVPPGRPRVTRPGFMCEPSTRSVCLAVIGARAWWRRRPIAGSPRTPTLLSLPSSAIVRLACGRSMIRPRGSR